jgi:excisionase family DNA binding protein
MMKQSMYKSFDELPLFLNAETAAKLMGISISSMYELMHEKGFPVLKIGSRLVVPRDKLLTWVEQNVGK